MTSVSTDGYCKRALSTPAAALQALQEAPALWRLGNRMTGKSVAIDREDPSTEDGRGRKDSDDVSTSARPVTILHRMKGCS